MADYTAHIKNQRYPQEREKGEDCNGYSTEQNEGPFHAVNVGSIYFYLFKLTFNDAVIKAAFRHHG